MKLVPNEATRAYNRRLFRALLREASYLPDCITRQYFHRHIVYRFRARNPREHGQKDEVTKEPESQEKKDEIQQLQETQHREGRKGLHKLNRANNGYENDLSKALILAYGRAGRRCHQLLVPLTRPTANRNPDNPVLRLKNRSNIPAETVDALPALSPIFQALLSSQVHHNPQQKIKTPLRKLDPDIPQRNLWERPMPQKRVVNAVKHWYGSLLRKAFPPLPDAEWDFVKEMATGLTVWAGPVPRRRYCGTEEDEYDYRKSIKIETAKELAVTPLAVEQRGGMDRHPHHMTPKYMKRHYQRLFRMCPRLDWSDDLNKWRVTWGSKWLSKPPINAKTNASMSRVLLGLKDSEQSASI